MTRKAILNDGLIGPLIGYCRAELSLDHAVVHLRCNRLSDWEKRCVLGLWPSRCVILLRGLQPDARNASQAAGVIARALNCRKTPPAVPVQSSAIRELIEAQLPIVVGFSAEFSDMLLCGNRETLSRRR